MLDLLISCVPFLLFVLPAAIYIVAHQIIVIRPIKEDRGMKSVVITLLGLAIINLIIGPLYLLFYIQWSETVPLGLARLQTLGPLFLWIEVQPSLLIASIYTIIATAVVTPPKTWGCLPKETNRLGKSAGTMAIRGILAVVFTEVCLIVVPILAFWIFFASFHW
jgi:hypothetical protein